MNTAQVVIVLYLLLELNVSSETLYETVKLTKENEAKKYLFGVLSSVSKTIAVNNRLLVIGSPDDMGTQGSVEIFSRKDNKRIAKLRPPSSSYEGHFGWCVAVNDYFIVVGAWSENKVYVYNTSEPFELLHTIRGRDDFGWSCSIDQENTLVVGAAFYNNRRGVAFVYKLNYLTGERSVPLIHTLQPNDENHFGFIVATTANFVAAETGKGVLYVFDKNTDRVCNEPQKITHGKSNTYLRTSLAINDGRLYIGKVNLNTVFIYTVSSSNAWKLKYKIHRDVGHIKGFGHTLAVNGNIMVVCDMYAERVGKCYLYMFDEGVDTWREIETLRPSDGIKGDRFGISLAMDDRTVFIGSRGKSQGYVAGAVYLYDITKFTQIDNFHATTTPNKSQKSTVLVTPTQLTTKTTSKTQTIPTTTSTTQALPTTATTNTKTLTKRSTTTSEILSPTTTSTENFPAIGTIPTNAVLLVIIITIFIVATLFIFFIRRRRIQQRQRSPTEQNEMEALNTESISEEGRNDVPVPAETPLHEGEYLYILFLIYEVRKK